MKHLDDVQFVDLLDGNAGPDAAAHVEACPVCSAGLMSMRSTLEAVAAEKNDEHAKPSPLIWEHFSRRVNERIDASRPSWTGWIRRPRFAGTLTAAALVLVVASGARTLYGPTVATPAGSMVSPETPTITDERAEDLEGDAAWAVVRTAAEDFLYEDAEAAGIAPPSGAAERVVSEMSNEERAELIRLLDSEMKRSGA